MKKKCLTAVSAVMAFLFLMGTAFAGITDRASVDEYGTEASGESRRPAVSGDGRYVAFPSNAGNLVTPDYNSWDIFVHDRQTGAIEMVSVDSSGVQGNSFSDDGPAISADGRHVAFTSWADNLVSNDTNVRWDIFVHDRQEGSTVRVSVATDGTQGNHNSQYVPAISADGRYVAFFSNANNLVAGDTNSTGDVFVHDRDTDEDGIYDEPGGTKTVRVSVASDGSEGNGQSSVPSISPDGRFVAFQSLATNLVAVDTNGTVRDVFVHDRDTDEDGIYDEPGAISTELVSLTSEGLQVSSISMGPDINGDGRYVAFTSNGALVPGYDFGNVFVRDRVLGTTEVASADIGRGIGPSISEDGRFVSFEYLGTVYIYDRTLDVTDTLSVDDAGTPGNDTSSYSKISDDGLIAVFGSIATNLVPDDTNGKSDVFVRDRDVDNDTYADIEDCDDDDAAINPGAAEIPYNGIDENCNGMTDDTDFDLDGYDYTVDCDDDDAAINPGAAEIPYNGIDENCNGMTDDTDFDLDGYDYTVDCDDDDDTIYPDAPETKHDSIDQDCNGYDLTIDILVATYDSSKETVEIEATSSHGSSANLVVYTFSDDPMKWSNGSGSWTYKNNNVPVDPGTVTVCGFEGCESADTTAP